MIRLFASDLDGTLFNKHHECDERIEEAIRKIVDKKRIFSVATGRGVNMVHLRGASNLSYYVCLNGAVVIDPNKELLHCEPIDKDILAQILDEFEDFNIEYVSWNRVYSRISKEEVLRYRRNVWKEAANDPWLDRFLNNIIINFACSQTKEDILKQDICKLNYHFEEGTDNSRLDDFLKKYSDKLVNAPSDKGIYEITKQGVNKATGIKWLASYLNIKEDDVAVYGDSGNDLVMLEAFKNSYAPKNASKEAKIKAGHIIGPYDEYSVIEHMLRTIDED